PDSLGLFKLFHQESSSILCWYSCAFSDYEETSWKIVNEEDQVFCGRYKAIEMQSVWCCMPQQEDLQGSDMNNPF
ncbi:unnamed protein product, partial [Prunus brigantina]